MRHKRGRRILHILHALTAKGIWPILVGLSILFVILGINRPGVHFSTFTSILYIGFVIAIVSTIYFVYRTD